MRQEYNWFGTRYNNYSSDFINKDKTGITIEKPINLSLLKTSPHIKAVSLEYGNAFKKNKIDFSEYLHELITVTSLEYLAVRNFRYSDLVISEEIVKAPLKFLQIYSSNNLDLSFLGELTLLETLILNCSNHMDIPMEILKCRNIKDLTISNKSGSIVPIYKLPKLEYVNLKTQELTNLETFTSENIKTLNISSPLNKMSSKTELLKLEKLNIGTGTDLIIPKNYFENSVKDISLNGSGITIQLPKTLPNLERMVAHYLSIPSLNAPKLKDLSIAFAKNKTLNEILEDVPTLESLTIRSGETFDCNIEGSKIPNLVSLNIDKISKVVSNLDLSSHKKLSFIKIEDGQNAEVKLPSSPKLSVIILSNVSNKKLNLKNMDMKIVGEYIPKDRYLENQLASNEIRIAECTQLIEITLPNSAKKVGVFNCKNLKDITIVEEPKYLNSFSLYNCDQIRKIPAELLHCNENIQFIWKNSSFELESKDFRIIIKDLTAEYDDQEKLEIGKFIFENNLDFKEIAVSAFAIKSRPTFKLLERFLHQLSKNETDFGKLQISNLEGKTITIAGKPHEKKTTIKEQIARIGMKYVAKAIDADFIITCYTAQLEYNKKHVFVSESTFAEYCKIEKPRFLVASASSEHINKLRQIMWSTDPMSENMALEMLKKGGLLDEVIGEAVVISKTSTDKSVRRKYKAFLKGKVNDDWLKLISSGNRSNYRLTAEILPDYTRAMYKRDHRNYLDFLRSNRLDLDLRMEAVKNHLVPVVLARPHYLQLNSLFKAELEFILNMPEVKGKLKRLIVSIIDEVPDSIVNHYTLKELEIYCHNYSKLPKQIYQLPRLSILHFSSEKLNYVADDILKLKMLKRIVFTANQPVSLPSTIMEMPKLTQTVFNGGRIIR